MNKKELYKLIDKSLAPIQAARMGLPDHGLVIYDVIHKHGGQFYATCEGLLDKQVIDEQIEKGVIKATRVDSRATIFRLAKHFKPKPVSKYYIPAEVMHANDLSGGAKQIMAVITKRGYNLFDAYKFAGRMEQESWIGESYIEELVNELIRWKYGFDHPEHRKKMDTVLLTWHRREDRERKHLTNRWWVGEVLQLHLMPHNTALD